MKFLTNFLSLLTKKEKIYFFLLVLSSVANTFLELLSIGLVIPLIGMIIDPEALIFKLNEYFPSLNFYNYTTQLDLNNYIVYFLIIFLLIYLIKNLFIFIFFYYQNKFVQHIEENFSKKILKKYLFQNFSFFLENNSSDLTAKLSVDLITFARGFVGPLITFASEIMIVIGICSIIYFFGLLKVGLIFLFFFVIAAFFLKIIGSYSKNWGRERKQFDSTKLDILKNTFMNIKSIILDNKQFTKINQFQDISKKLAILQRKIITLNIVPKISFEIFGIFSIVIVLYFLIENNHSKTYIITTIGFLVAVAYRVIPSFQRLIFCYQQISYSKVVLKNLKLDLNLPNQINDTKEKINFKNTVKLSNVSFYYNTKNKIILDNLNLEIVSGKMTGIYGESGAGKSTLVDLISGLNKPKIGELLIDNIKIDTPKLLRMWQNEIAYVTQNTALFNGSLKENIIFSDIYEKYDPELLNLVINKSQLTKFISTLPSGIETDVGELGNKLSGGQKQRIGIARALYKKPKFIIFDEATNALDYESEKKILNTIYDLRKNKTIVIISHKKDIINLCDKILEIKNSKITEREKIN